MSRGECVAFIPWLAAAGVVGYVLIEVALPHLLSRLETWRAARRQEIEHTARCRRALEHWGKQ